MERITPWSWGMGWYNLTEAEIEKRVKPRAKGVYLLTRGPIVTKVYAGRSSDLRRRLNEHRRTGKYDLFRFSYITTEKDRYMEECKRFHAIPRAIGVEGGGKIHPAVPRGKNWSCPQCGS
jgi:predicted GIY-YIG superfamily endonuclease